MATSAAGAGLVAMTILQTGLPVAAVLQNLAPILAGKGVPASSSYRLKKGALRSVTEVLIFERSMKVSVNSVSLSKSLRIELLFYSQDAEGLCSHLRHIKSTILQRWTCIKHQTRFAI